MLRLTLRTLLAWLDGVLPPEEVDAFTEKLGSSNAARTLLDRIRAVVAHPGLDAPKVIGKGLAADANTVAEYLTNSLPTDSVAGFERICIESDVHLAEVASCHRMLAEARTNPQTFRPPEAEELHRLLAKVGGGPAAAVSPRSKTKAESPVAISQQAISQPKAGPATTGPTKPSPKKQKTAWASVLAAMSLVLLLAGTLAWRLAPQWLGGSVKKPPDVVAATQPPVEQRAAAMPAVEERGGEPKPALPGPEAVAEAMPSRDALQQDPSQIEEPKEQPANREPVPDGTPQMGGAAPIADPAIPLDTTDSPPQAGPDPAAGRVPGGQALAIGAKPAIPTKPVAEPMVEPATAVPQRKNKPAIEDQPTDEPAFAVMGDAPIFLKRVGEAGGPADWAVVPPGGAVSTKADLLVPEGFVPTLSVGETTIRLIGPARAVLRRPGEAAAEFELVFGRAVVTGIGGGRSLSFAAGDLAGRLEAGSPIGVEVRLERVPGSDPETVPSTAVGSVAFPEGGRLSLDPEGGRDADSGDAPAADGPDKADGLVGPDGSIPTGVVVMGGGLASRGLPDWLTSSSPPRLLDRLAADAMAASLSAAPPAEALERLLGENRLENRSLAAATLAIMGRYEPLAELLAAEDPGRRLPSRAWENLERATIPLALARGPASAARMLAALEAVMPPDDGKLVRQLAIGFSDEAIAGGDDATLVAALEHPSLLVRRLAATRLLQIVSPSAADRLRYRPDGPEEGRKDAVKWWRARLEKGLIRRAGEGGLSKAEGE